MANERDRLLKLMGGREGVLKTMKIFYDKVYKDPWIGQYFTHISQEHIENQQTDFMNGALGGDKIYSGRLPIPAHEHMYVTDELFDLRNKLLLEALKEVDAHADVIEGWMKIDNAFKNGIVKSSLSDCKKRFTTDNILNFPNPNKKGF